MSVPSDVKATAPTTSPPFVFHDTTGFASLSRSIAQTPRARRRTSLTSPRRASCPLRRARTTSSWRAGTAPDAECPCRTRGRARAACRRWTRHSRHRTAGRESRTGSRSLPRAAHQECDRPPVRPAAGGGRGGAAPRRAPAAPPARRVRTRRRRAGRRRAPGPPARPSAGTPSPGSPRRLRYPTAPRPPPPKAAPGSGADGVQL